MSTYFRPYSVCWLNNKTYTLASPVSESSNYSIVIKRYWVWAKAVAACLNLKYLTRECGKNFLCVVKIDFIVCINIRLLFLFFFLLVPLAEAYSLKLLFLWDKQVFLFVPVIAWGLFPVWLDCQWHDRWDGGSVLGNAWALVFSALESHFPTRSFYLFVFQNNQWKNQWSCTVIVL